MASSYYIRRAGENDLDAVMSVLQDRARWLHDVKQSRQWSNVGESRAVFRDAIRRGNVWVLVVDDVGGEIVGTVTLSRDPDLDFWTPAQRQQSALYLSKLAISTRWAGRRLGELMMSWAVDRAARGGISLVRLDTSRTSAELQAYYLERGWRRVGVVELDHRQSGALFEHRAQRLSTILTGRAVGGMRFGDIDKDTILPA